MSARVVGVHGHGLFPLHGRRLVLALLGQVGCDINLLVKVDRRRVNVIDSAGVHVDELGNVHGAVRGRRVLNQNCRCVIAVLVDVRQKHLGVRRSTLGRENHPAPVRRKAVP